MDQFEIIQLLASGKSLIVMIVLYILMIVSYIVMLWWQYKQSRVKNQMEELIKIQKITNTKLEIICLELTQINDNIKMFELNKLKKVKK